MNQNQKDKLFSALEASIRRVIDYHPALGHERFDGLARTLAESALKDISDIHETWGQISTPTEAVVVAHAPQTIDQPPPISTDLRPSWELVIEHVEHLQLSGAHASLVVEEDVFPLVLVDMRERDALGRARYGTPLTAGNGRDHLVDAYQELLDGCAYLMTELVERGADLAVRITEEDVPDQAERWYLRDVRKLCLWQIRSAIQLRALIKGRAERTVLAKIMEHHTLSGVQPGFDPAVTAPSMTVPSVQAKGMGHAVVALKSRLSQQHNAAVLHGLQLINSHLIDGGHEWLAASDMSDVHAAQQWLAERAASADGGPL